MRFRFWASAFYFAFFAATGSFGPFLNAFYQKAGIPVEKIGILAALPLLISMLANPLWSLAADAFHLHRRLLPLTMLLTLPFAFLLTRAHDFWSLALLATLYAFCLSPILSLGDYAVMRELGDKGYEYGRLRIWGAVGYGVSALYGGTLIQWLGLERSIFTFLVMMAFGAFVATHLPDPRLAKGISMRESFRVLSTDRRWYAFLGSVLLAGMGFAAIHNYYILYLKELGAGEQLFGLSVALSGISELPIFFFSANLMRRWSPRGLLAFAMGMLVIRLLLTSLFHNIWLVILVQMMHGLTFSALWSAGVNYTQEIAPPGLGTSAQALFNITQFGMAGMLGAFFGGLVYKSFGGPAVFQAAAFVVLLGWLVFQAINRRSARKTILQE